MFASCADQRCWQMKVQGSEVWGEEVFGDVMKFAGVVSIAELHQDMKSIVRD